MHRYGVREVEKLLRLPRSTIRALIEAGFVSPARGRGRAWMFSFQDLLVLRTAQALASANVPRRRITRSVKELRRHLPDSMPLSGLRICAEADRIVVKEGGSRWQVDSGQYLLGFEGDPATGTLSVVEPPPQASRGADAMEWFDRAAELEERDPAAALQAYGQAILEDPRLVEAHINFGRLLHEAGELERAEQAYRAGLSACGGDPGLLFNLGVLLHDKGREQEAMAAYEQALQADPRAADCHYNLALLCESLDRPKEAIRHMAQYRRLTSRK